MRKKKQHVVPIANDSSDAENDVEEGHESEEDGRRALLDIKAPVVKRVGGDTEDEDDDAPKPRKLPYA